MEVTLQARIFVSADGVRLVADHGGAADAPAVILLHGGGQTRHSWSRAVSCLVEQGFQVINFDARGHGESDWSEHGAYHLTDRVADLRAIVETLSVPYVLVGASLGGGTSILAVDEGLRPAGLVVRGLSSDVVSDAGVAAFRATVPHLEVLDVAGAGHMVAGDRNDAFNEGIITFARRVLGQALPIPG